MALRTAARSVFGISRCITGRRSATTSVPAEQINKKRSIYVCFDERSRKCQGARRVVRSFDEEEYLNADEHTAMLKLVAFKRGPTAAFGVLKPWVCVGDKILHISGERHIKWLNTNNRPLKFENASRTKTRFKSFPNKKCYIAWGEVDGKLYCIDNNTDYLEKTRQRNLFEVLDPENNTDWRPLPDPPYIQGCCTRHHRALFSSGSRKILGWDRDIPGTFCFDVTDSENGWKELSYDIGPHGPRPLLIHHQNHPQFGDFHLLFSYSPLADDPLVVFPFYMSNDCQSFRPIFNFPVELPESCYHYLPNPGDRLRLSGLSDLEYLHMDHIFTRFEFVNLGNKRFGLILHKYPYTDPNTGPRSKGDPETTGGLLYLTFKYDIFKVNNALQIRSRLLGSRHLRYHTDVCCDVTMGGVFFI